MTLGAKRGVPVFLFLWIALSSVVAGAQQISFSPSAVNFGNVSVDSAKTQTVVVTNITRHSIGVYQASVSGKGYTISGISCPVALRAGESTSLSLTFAATSVETDAGSVTLVTNNWWNKLKNGSLTSVLNASGTGVAGGGYLTALPASVAFGSVVVGKSQMLPVTVTNTGGVSVTISAATATGSGFTISGSTLPLTLSAGQSASFTAQFAPVSAGAATGNVTISSDGSNATLNIPVSGTGVASGTLASNPTSLSFGSVQVGSTGTLSETLTNIGGVTVNISQANVTGTGFSVVGLTLPTVLTAGQSVTFTMQFTPAAAGAISGNLAIISDGSNSTLNVSLSGTGTALGQLAVSPATLNFGNVVVGANASLNGSLTATGAPVTVSSASFNSSEFTFSGITLPTTIPAGQSALFTVTFTPNASGVANGNLTFVSNASNSTTVEALTGTGTAPQQHSVDLDWNVSQSPDVVGYNIYRRTPSGSYGSPINTSLVAAAAYTDNSVTAGQTYFYVAKAVDGNNDESGPSNEVQATVPSP